MQEMVFKFFSIQLDSRLRWFEIYSFMARANWVLINKPNLARAVDAHAQMLILSCRNFGVFITLTANISASARCILIFDNQDQLAAYIVRFLKISVGRKKNKRTIVKKRIFS